MQASVFTVFEFGVEMGSGIRQGVSIDRRKLFSCPKFQKILSVQ